VFRRLPFAEIVTELRDRPELPAPPFAAG